MSSLLIAEPPLQVLRSLAKRVGLNQALVLQQLHYYSLRGGEWVERRFEVWQEVDFPFWSEKTVRRALADLLELGLVRRDGEAFRWKIDRAKLAGISGQIVQGSGQIGLAREGAEEREVEKTPPRTPRNRVLSPAEEPIGFSEWVGYHAEHTDRSVPRAGTGTRSSLARTFAALMAEGYELDDFKAVTDLMRLDPWWVARPGARKFVTALRKGEFGERVDEGRRLRAAGAVDPKAAERELYGGLTKAEHFEKLNAAAQGRAA